MQPGRKTPGASELSDGGTNETSSCAVFADIAGPAVLPRIPVIERRDPEGSSVDAAGGVAVVEPAVNGQPADVLRRVIGDEQFVRWFHDKANLSIRGEELLVTSGSAFHGNWIQKQFRVELGRVAESLLGPHGRVCYEAKARQALVTGAGGPTSPVAAVATVPGGRQPTALSVSGATTPTPASRGDGPADREEQGELFSLRRRPSELADFVVGQGSELAHAAIRQLLANPQSAPNPLYLYGATGLGKTHLLEAVGRQLRRQYPAFAVTCLTAENFANLFTQALREHRLPGFRQRFRSIDVLIVDDVDFFDGKRGLQEEFLHTIQQLQAHGKLLIFSGDRNPRLLTKTSDELRSRIAAGLVCRIDAPDQETRRKIVRLKSTAWPEAMTAEALDYVADRFSANVRELEGAVHCLVTHHKLLGRRVGVTTARQALGELERDCVRVVRLVDIDRAVTTLFGLEPDALKSARRSREVSQPRTLAMFLARSLTRCAYSEIGAYFGGRNHSTVIAAERRIVETVGQSESWKIAARSWSVSDLVETLTQQLVAG
jgi:chromosomal replication initiator protein